MIRCQRLICGVSLACLAFIASTAQAKDFFFRDGDTIVILGDSITEQHLYSNYLEMWTVSRFPSWKLTFRNAGIGGDTSRGGNARFQRDIVSRKASALTVDFGMNDGGYQPLNPIYYQAYMDGLRGIAKQAKAANIRVAWLTPSPVEKAEDGPALAGYNQTLEKFSAGVQEVAKENDGLFVDQFHPFVELEDKARAANPKNRIGGGDVVHPGAPGQAVMAWAVLKGLQFPSLVSAVEIDAAGGKIIQAQQCQVSELQGSDHGIRFQQRDASLPFFPNEAKSILKWAPILDELNQYQLKVTGLLPGQYEIRLEGKKAAQRTAEELAAGTNLAEAVLTTGPIAEQVQAAWQALQAKNLFVHDHIFRGVVLAPVFIPEFLKIQITPQEIESRREAAIKERLAKTIELDEAIRKALVMKPHRVEIVSAAK